MTNTVSDAYLISLVFTQFTYFPQDVAETHTSLHSTELQLILRYDVPDWEKFKYQKLLPLCKSNYMSLFGMVPGYQGTEFTLTCPQCQCRQQQQQQQSHLNG